MLGVVPACGLLWHSLREAREYHCRATTPGNTPCGHKGPRVCTYGRKPLVAEARGYLAMSTTTEPRRRGRGGPHGDRAPSHDGRRGPAPTSVSSRMNVKTADSRRRRAATHLSGGGVRLEGPAGKRCELLQVNSWIDAATKKVAASTLESTSRNQHHQRNMNMTFLGPTEQHRVPHNDADAPLIQEVRGNFKYR